MSKPIVVAPETFDVATGDYGIGLDKEPVVVLALEGVLPYQIVLSPEAATQAAELLKLAAAPFLRSTPNKENN